ncbi:hypothetical protein SDC9_157732 [bioreactor metagenome]|uniref:Uncharacterized protein n=1 Tax=bioreactor metagenome TaxID=1076179 RepID=A0A645F875_9ZZZZ
MERADITRIVIAAQAAYAPLHFIGGFIGERHAEYVGGRDADLVHKIGKTVRQRACFARTCARDHAHEPFGRRNRLPLPFVEPFEQIHIDPSVLMIPYILAFVSGGYKNKAHKKRRKPSGSRRLIISYFTYSSSVMPLSCIAVAAATPT